MTQLYKLVVEPSGAVGADICESPGCPFAACPEPISGPGGVQLRLCDHHVEKLVGGCNDA